MILQPLFRSVARGVTAEEEAKALYTSQREALAKRFEDYLKDLVAQRGVVVEKVLLRKVALPPTVRDAVEQKLRAEQDAERMKFVLQRENQEAERVIDLYGVTLPELMVWLAEQGQPAYRARQIFEGLYRRGVQSAGDLKQLPAELCESLARAFSFRTLEPAQHRVSEDGTQKWLWRLSDGQFIESVLIPSDSRKTLCVSTQVGCAYSCAFCASGLDGFKRDLTAGEIVQQVLLANESLRHPRESEDRIPASAGMTRRGVSHVVFMGMGEPLSNYDNVLKAIRVLNAPEGLRIGVRRITISTVGLVPMIERLAQEGLQVELSVSLHAPNDRLRGQIMPVNRKYPLSKLMEACRAYVRKTKRIITFEYILIDQINDGSEQAKELAHLLKGVPCKVNLIPCHPIPGVPFGRPPQARMLAFERALRRKVPCTLRKSRGLDIEGACGQLRLQQLEGFTPAAVE